MPFVSVTPFVPAEWRLYRHMRLAALATDPDAFGSLYSQAAEIPAQDWRSRLEIDAARDLPMCARFAGSPAGMGWVRIGGFEEKDSASDAHLYQMWAAPRFRGCGVGRALIGTAISWAAERSDTLVLGVTWSDSPARRLYVSEGFSAFGPAEPLRPGSDRMLRNMRLELPQA